MKENHRHSSAKVTDSGYIQKRQTNGVVEGINNRLRTIARRAYGFHSAEALISMLFQCAGGIELDPPLPTH